MSEYKELKFNIDGVYNYINNKSWGSFKEIICEFYGSFPGKINNMSIDLNNNYLIISGDDGGITEKDFNNLSEIFSSNDENKGHSKYGLGSRNAGFELLKNIKDKCFYIIDYNYKCIEYKFKNNKKYSFKKLKIDEAKKIYKKYNSHIDNKKITKWIIPIDGYFKEDKKKINIGMENLKNDLKIRWNQLLINNDCNIFFKGDKIEINKENNFFEFDKINKIEILNVREKKDNKKIGNSFHIYKITDYNDYIKYYKIKYL